jgi:tetratricopeptide (TPR) repeat protein
MAAPSEIEKLERRYAENPDGRFFAPLADAYRKAGSLDRALELVRAGLAKHPDYLSAHIVLGRCLLDKNDDAEAGRTFERVLALDSENIIALKCLAEIAERGGRADEARAWLQKLLVVDAMNTEAAADLERLGGAVETPGAPAAAPQEGEVAGVSFADLAAEVEAAPAAPPPEAEGAAQPLAPVAEAPAAAETPAAAEAVPEPPRVSPDAPTAELPMPTPAEVTSWAPEQPAAAAEPAAFQGLEPQPEPELSTLEPAAEQLPADPHPLPQELQVEESGLDLMPFDDSLAWGTGERSSRAIRAEDIQEIHHDDGLTTPAVEFLAELEAAQGGAAAPAPLEPAQPQPLAYEPPAEGIEPSPPGPEDTTVEIPARRSGSYAYADGSGFSPAPTEAAASGPPTGLPLILPEDVTPAAELARPSSKLVQIVSPTPPAEERPATEPMLSETLGDLYMKQGFRSEAAGVYRRLLEQRPGDPAIAAKLQAVEGPPRDLSAGALGAESAGAWLRRVAAARVGVGGTAAQPPAPPGPPDIPDTPAPPTPPAPPAPAAIPEVDTAGPSPLEAAFATPPAEAAGEPTHPAPEAFSLDQIFGAAAGSSSPTPEATSTDGGPDVTLPPGTSFDDFFGAPTTPGSVRPAMPSPETPGAGGEEDLNAFNAWLQGLKR